MINSIINTLEVAIQSKDIHASIDALKNDLHKLNVVMYSEPEESNDYLINCTLADFKDLLTDHLYEQIASDASDVEQLKYLSETAIKCQIVINQSTLNRRHDQLKLIDVSKHNDFEHLRMQARDFGMNLVSYI